MHMLRSGIASLLALGALGCPSPGGDVDGGNVIVVEDAGADAGASDAGGCSSGEHQLADGGCGITLQYAVGPELPSTAAARDHHVSWIFSTDAGAFLAIAGGVTEDSQGLIGTPDVWTARLDASGMPETWRASPSMPDIVAGASLAIARNRVYMMAGLKSTGMTSSVLSAPMLDDGSIGTWRTEAAQLNGAARYHGVGFSHGNQVCSVGGFDSRAVFDDVQCADANATDGSLGAFTRVGTLPSARTHHSVVAVGNAVFVTAGFGLGGSFPDIIRAEWQSDGMLGTWAVVAGLPDSRRTGAASYLDGALWLLNGENGDGFSAPNAATEIWRFELHADGGLGPVQVVTPSNPVPRRHTHQAPVYNGRIYAVAGSDQAKAYLKSTSVMTPEH